MATVILKNPFVIGRYVSDHYFCDREKETAFLAKQVLNGRNVALISPRRMGKTGLIHHLFNQEVVMDSYIPIFVDIYATTSLAEFVYLLGKEIYLRLKPQKSVWSERFFQIVRSLRVGFKMDPVTGEPGFDIGLGDIQAPQTTLDEIFEYLEISEKPCLIAIDEFQQVSLYEEQTVENLLRTKIQQCSKTQFIFSGSKRHLMNHIFNSPAKPFYQSAICMELGTIPLPSYTSFVVRLFEEYDKQIEPELISQVYDSFSGCTWFIQMMMNELFAITPKRSTCPISCFDEAWNNIILSQEASYRDMLSRLSIKQKMVLQAIAKAGVAPNVTSSVFIKKYNLVSASSVQAALKPLLKQDIITQDEHGCRVYDFFFAAWLRKEY